jgi:hypothetical protein
MTPWIWEDESRMLLVEEAVHEWLWEVYVTLFTSCSVLMSTKLFWKIVFSFLNEQNLNDPWDMKHSNIYVIDSEKKRWRRKNIEQIMIANFLKLVATLSSPNFSPCA